METIIKVQAGLLLFDNHNHLDNPMTPEQTALALQLVALLEADPEGQANAKTYGNWFEHLIDQLSDERIEQLNLLSCS